MIEGILLIDGMLLWVLVVGALHDLRKPTRAFAIRALVGATALLAPSIYAFSADSLTAVYLAALGSLVAGLLIARWWAPGVAGVLFPLCLPFAEVSFTDVTSYAPFVLLLYMPASAVLISIGVLAGRASRRGLEVHAAEADG